MCRWERARRGRPLAKSQTGIRADTRARRARSVTFDKMAKTPAVGKKAAKTPKKAGKSTKRSKRVESYRYALFRRASKRLSDGSAVRPPGHALDCRSLLGVPTHL